MSFFICKSFDKVLVTIVISTGSYNYSLCSPGSSHSDPLLARNDVNIVSVESSLDPGGRHSQYLPTKAKQFYSENLLVVEAD